MRLRPTPPSVFLAACLAGSAFAQNQKMPKDGAEVIRDANGSRYSVLREGTGEARPKRGDRVHFHYSGWLTDGTLFETSRRRDKPMERILGVAMPKAWVFAMAKMRAGEKLKVTVPPDLGFGKWGSPGKPPEVPEVPPNSELVFEFELVSIEKGIELPEFRLPNLDNQKATSSGLKYETLVPPRDPKSPTPKNRGRFLVEFTMFNERAHLIVTSRLPHVPPATGRLGGKLEGPAFLEEAIGLMRVGQRSRFEVPPNLCYGAEDRGYLLPPDSVTVWELELVSLEPPPKPRPVPKFARLSPMKQKRTDSGLRYEVIQEGSGTKVGEKSRLEIHYVGWQTNGRMFEESMSKGVPLTIDVTDKKLIPAWTEGLRMMREGAVYRFMVPSRLGYGTLGNKELGIGPGRVLYFQLEVVRVF